MSLPVKFDPAKVSVVRSKRERSGRNVEGGGRREEGSGTRLFIRKDENE